MHRISYSKLKAYNKAEEFSKKIKDISDSIPKNGLNGLRSRFRNNPSQTLKLIRIACIRGGKFEKFIECMDQVIISNSEFESLLFEIQTKRVISVELCEELMADCEYQRSLQLDIINNASLFFETGKAPESWFEG